MLCHAMPRHAMSCHAADAIDEEIPGSARADVEPLVLGDTPYDPYKGGGAGLLVRLCGPVECLFGV